ncbi:MAG: S1 RNA-binding domain-containing protein, partial [Candidatus Delongbacteria bacterium]|nr:S1 RNA-binding domain-containing protein [Candidatus Delongbacteria bacterium]
LNLFSEGATIPFIARYRKEMTGGLDENQLRLIDERAGYLKSLNDRKTTVIKTITELGKLTPELSAKIEKCLSLTELEDIYLPYKPKRKTKASVAKEKGLEPLALFILNNPNFSGDFNSVCTSYVSVDKDVNSIEDAINGAMDILAEMISEHASVRKFCREYLQNRSSIISAKAKEKVKKKVDDEDEPPTGGSYSQQSEKKAKDVYQIYHDFKVNIRTIKPHQILAINRGETEGLLKIKLDYDKDFLSNAIRRTFFKTNRSYFNEMIEDIIKNSWKRLLYPSLEREIRKELTEKAELHAVEVFAANLRQLLLQPPLLNNVIMGIDPGFISGCKIAVIDPTGKYLYGNTMYPHPPQRKLSQAVELMLSAIKKYKVQVIAIGNGTASRETEAIVATMIKENELECKYLIVNEAGASVYSASKIAQEEFPDLEAAQRGNISIARRVLDPLAELVKIDPKSIGVGLYQHDINQKVLASRLNTVVESVVNHVGVDINTASSPLLCQVSGITKRSADKIINLRNEKGNYKSRAELKKITKMTPKAFEQCAGFLNINNGINPLDVTFIHPESYAAVDKLLAIYDLQSEKIDKPEIIEVIRNIKPDKKLAEKIGVGLPTLQDILENLLKPGRDPREDLSKPILRSDVLKTDDLSVGMKLKGTVRNIVDFGAFIDIGIKQDALVHISQMADKFVKNPLDIVKVGDIVDVTIFSIDKEKGRVGLSMKKN